MIENAYIIDDDPISTYLTEIALEGFSKRMKSFSSGRVALEEIVAAEESKAAPFVIFLDLNMPQMDGWGFLEAISRWQDRLRERCSVVVLSSSINQAEMQRSGEYSAVLKFISKPLDEEGLASVHSLLRQKRSVSKKYFNQL